MPSHDDHNEYPDIDCPQCRRVPRPGRSRQVTIECGITTVRHVLRGLLLELGLFAAWRWQKVGSVSRCSKCARKQYLRCVWYGEADGRRQLVRTAKSKR